MFGRFAYTECGLWCNMCRHCGEDKPKRTKPHIKKEYSIRYKTVMWKVLHVDGRVYEFYNFNYAIKVINV